MPDPATVAVTRVELQTDRYHSAPRLPSEPGGNSQSKVSAPPFRVEAERPTRPRTTRTSQGTSQVTAQTASSPWAPASRGRSPRSSGTPALRFAPAWTPRRRSAECGCPTPPGRGIASTRPVPAIESSCSPADPTRFTAVRSEEPRLRHKGRPCPERPRRHPTERFAPRGEVHVQLARVRS